MRWLCAGLAVFVAASLGACDSAELQVVGRDDNGCPSSVGGSAHIDWAPAVRFQGVTYHAVEGALADRLVGKRVGEVRCRIADVVRDPLYRLRDGEATFLRPGTGLHELRGMDPSFRIVARDEGRTVVYERSRLPGARTGRDLLPFDEQGVVGARVRDDQRGDLLGRLTKVQARALTAELQAADVGKPSSGDGTRVFLDLLLRGQPPVTLVLSPGERSTNDGIVLSDAVIKVIARFL